MGTASLGESLWPLRLFSLLWQQLPQQKKQHKVLSSFSTDDRSAEMSVPHRGRIPTLSTELSEKHCNGAGLGFPPVYPLPFHLPYPRHTPSAPSLTPWAGISLAR